MGRILGVMLALALVAPAHAAKLISATLGAKIANYSGPCPADLSFTGEISSPRAAKIVYRLLRSDGGAEPQRILEFKDAGRQPVALTWQFSGPKQATTRAWAAIEILEPIRVQSVPAQFSARCTPRPATSVKAGGRGGPLGLVPWSTRYGLIGPGLADIPCLVPCPVGELAGAAFYPSIIPTVEITGTDKLFVKWNGRPLPDLDELNRRLFQLAGSENRFGVRIVPLPGARSNQINAVMDIVRRYLPQATVWTFGSGNFVTNVRDRRRTSELEPSRSGVFGNAWGPDFTNWGAPVPP